MTAISINGQAIEVLGCACEPNPPIGDAVCVHLRRESGFYCATSLRREVSLCFAVDGISYGGQFRMTGCTMGPNGNDCRYASVGPVIKL
jgi:hypothetical protein